MCLPVVYVGVTQREACEYACVVKAETGTYVQNYCDAVCPHYKCSGPQHSCDIMFLFLPKNSYREIAWKNMCAYFLMLSFFFLIFLLLFL